MTIFRLGLAFFQICFAACFASRARLVAENLALRHQVVVLRRCVKRPRLRQRDRIFWVWLSRMWADWRGALLIVRPETVARWHRRGFRLYWRWKIRRGRRLGRPHKNRAIRLLIARMARENPTWGAPRIYGELKLLGLAVAQSTVSKYMPRRREPPSLPWRAFLKNHAAEIAACDFFTIPTLTFGVLYVFVVLSHRRWRIVHINVTAHPTAAWTAQQIVEAFPDESATRYLLRDRDSIYGATFRARVDNMGIKQVVTAWRSPWQNPYVERVIGSIRRECLDHVIAIDEGRLKRILNEYVSYYNESRCHLSLDKNSPIPRDVEPPREGRSESDGSGWSGRGGGNGKSVRSDEKHRNARGDEEDRRNESDGEIIAMPYVGGLHHRYTRAA